MRILLNTNQPTEIWYADKPPALGGIPRKISVAELSKTIGSHYTHSESIYTNEKDINLSEIKNNQFLKASVLKFLRLPYNDSLVICYINNEVGYGVFARKNIQMGEILALYTGELKSKLAENFSKDTPTYGHDFAGTNYYIDAFAVGGVARFFQHLPNNPNELADKLIASFRQNISLLDNYIDYSIPLEETQGLDRALIKQQMAADILLGQGSYFKGMLSYTGQSEIESDWHLKRTRFSGLTKDKVASANVVIDSLVVEGKPILFCWAERNIAVGEQLGFDYGFGYWVNRMPLLFNQSGSVISSQDYSYSEMPLAPSKFSSKAFFFSKVSYEKAKQDCSPICQSLMAPAVSFFWIRKKLSENNVIDSINQPLSYLNSFAIYLKNIFPSDVKFEIYERDPEAKNINERYIYDVVCQTDSRESWGRCCEKLKESSINQFCKYYESTQEIIICGVNVNAVEMHKFVR